MSGRGKYYFSGATEASFSFQGGSGTGNSPDDFVEEDGEAQSSAARCREEIILHSCNNIHPTDI